MEEMKVNFERSIQNLLKDNEESARIVREQSKEIGKALLNIKKCEDNVENMNERMNEFEILLKQREGKGGENMKEMILPHKKFKKE